jgi:hypothetical protein
MPSDGSFGDGMENRDQGTSSFPGGSGNAPTRTDETHSTIRRRSSRVTIDVPVEITGRTANGVAFREETRTIVVNAHGALLNLASLNITSTIVIKNKQTDGEVECRVINQKERQQGRADLAIEFIGVHPTFWAITFPPDD